MRKAFFVLVFSFCILKIPALDWPVSPLALISTFGESQNGHFHKGIDLAGLGLPVYPVEEGEVLFLFEERVSPLQLPSGLGSFVVLEHNRELRSLYAHLKRGSIPQDPGRITREEPLGITGDTGNATGPHLHLALFDMEFNQIINPLLALPPLLDTRKPTLEAVSLKTGTQAFKLQSSNLVPSGVYELSVTAYDVSEEVRYFCPRAIFSLEVYLNGEQKYRITHEALQERRDSLVLVQSPTLTHKDYYQNQWEMRPGRITLNNGESRLEIVVRDFAGNETVRTFLLKVQN